MPPLDSRDYGSCANFYFQSIQQQLKFRVKTKIHFGEDWIEGDAYSFQAGPKMKWKISDLKFERRNSRRISRTFDHLLQGSGRTLSTLAKIRSNDFEFEDPISETKFPALKWERKVLVIFRFCLLLDSLQLLSGFIYLFCVLKSCIDSLMYEDFFRCSLLASGPWRPHLDSDSIKLLLP